MSQVQQQATEGRRARWVSALHPVLFSAYPALFLWSRNLSETDPADVALPLLVMTVATALVTVALGIVLRDVRRAALFMAPLVVGLLMFGHVARLLRPFPIPVLLQAVGWVGLVALAGIAAWRLSGQRVQAIGRALTGIAAILIAITLVLILPFQLTGRAAQAGTGDDQALATSTSAPRRDVYWFIFDRYGSDRSFELLHGVKNDLTPWLREQGFTVLDDSHANHVRTYSSLASTMQMRHLQDIAGFPAPGVKDLAFLKSAIRSSRVVRQFKALGYRYVNIGSWWDATRTSPLADVNLHAPGPSEFAATLLEATALPRLLPSADFGQEDMRRRYWENNTYELEAVQGQRDAPGPKFVFTHVLLPHPPYVHNTDGGFLTPEAARELSGRTQFVNQLAFANRRIREIVGDLLALPEAERPIIILQADEGPRTATYKATRGKTWDWNTALPEDLEIKFGILNAWYVPDDTELGLYPTMTSVNTFPVLFRDYFGIDYELLPDLIYGSRLYQFPYDLVDITGRMPSLQ